MAVDLVTLCYCAVAFSGVTTLGVVAASVICIIFIIKIGNKNLFKIADELPKTVECMVESRIPVPVIIALCEQANVSMTELIEIYEKDSMERKVVVERTFGSNNQTVQRFLKNEGSKFMQEGYAGEDIIRKMGKAE